MPRTLHYALLVALFTALGDEIASPIVAQPDKAADETPLYAQTPGHRRMLALLRDIRDRSPAEHFWLGNREALALRERASALLPDSGDFTRFEVMMKLGDAEQRLGNEREAIERLSEAYALLPKVEHELDEGWVEHVIFNLGVAYLRMGETENCSKLNSPDSCLLPIRRGGIHVHQEGSREAIRYFTEVLGRAPKNTPGFLSALWLLNIAYMTVDAYPDEVPSQYLIPPGSFESEEPFPRFPNVAAGAGIDTFSLSGGAVAEDFDLDGDLDLLVSTYDPAGQVRLHLNRGDGTFSDRTRDAGLTGILGGLNMVQADYDDDGDVDVLMLRGAWMEEWGRHPRSLLRNNGDGTFTDVAFDVGLGEVVYPSQTASWADYDNDGDLDLYIGNETNGNLEAPCQLFLNRGGTFTDVAASAGVTNLRWTKGVVWGDYDRDGYPDLYVSNLGAENRLYRNRGNGTFEDVAPSLGVTGPMRSFPTWFWDFDNDGVLDIYVSAYEALIDDLARFYLGLPVERELACLYRGDGRGGFQEVARERNLRGPSAPMGANFGDLDNDGYLDFYLATGYPPYFALMPNLMYHNRGGEGFADVTIAGGFGSLQKGHAIAFADFDGDGDLEVFAQMGGARNGDEFYDSLYQNPGFGNRWLTVELVGVASNRSAIGARLRVEVTEGGTRRSIYKHVNSGGSFGASPLRQTLGLGKAERIDALEIEWPMSGRTQTFRDVPLDSFLRILESEEGR